ncbi:MAG: phosphoribosylformylglycinamidine synthase subunit PurQ [Bacillota bacterium]
MTFFGSNCDRDCLHVVGKVLGQPVRFVSHREESLEDLDCVILPGGFSYGDYLRGGAIAARTPVMDAVARFAGDGGMVLGICNGFQILCEANLLPGALITNSGSRFICRSATVRLDDNETAFTGDCQPGEVLSMPIAHHQGNYRPPPEGFLGRVVLRYCDRDGRTGSSSNPNGSWDSVAGIANARGNVFGLMPHPERASEGILGDTDGRKIFTSALAWWRGGTSYV